MCVRCNAVIDRPVVVSVVHQASGRGFSVYACPDCAPVHLSPKTAIRLVLEHAVLCADCGNDTLCPTGTALDKVQMAARARGGSRTE